MPKLSRRHTKCDDLASQDVECTIKSRDYCPCLGQSPGSKSTGAGQTS